MDRLRDIIISMLLVLAGFCAGRTFEHWRTTQPIVDDIRQLESDKALLTTELQRELRYWRATKGTGKGTTQ